MKDLDPSLSFGYLLESYDDYLSWLAEINKINSSIRNQFQILSLHTEGAAERIQRE